MALAKLIQQDTASKVSIVSLRGIEAVVNSMAEHLDHIGVQEWGITILWHLYHKDEIVCWSRLKTETPQEYSHSISSYLHLADCGGIDAILQAIKSYVGYKTIASYGCYLLRILARAEENEEKIGALGGVEVILKVLQSHSDDIEVWEEGCRALSNLAVNDENKDRITAHEGIEVILDGMRFFPNEVGIQMYSCSVLANLAASDELEVKIGQLGGIGLILYAMERYGLNLDLAEETCRALWNMTVDSDNNRKACALGAVQKILQTMHAHPLVAVIQHHCCGLLLNVARCDSKMIAAHGGIEKVVASMNRLADAARVQREGINLLEYIARTSDSAAVLNAGGVEAVLGAFADHSANRVVVEPGFRIMRTLAAQGEPFRSRIAAQGGVEAVLTAMRLNMDDSERLLGSGLRALMDLGDETRRRIWKSVWRWLRQRELGPAGGARGRWSARVGGAALLQWTVDAVSYGCNGHRQGMALLERPLPADNARLRGCR